MGPYDDTLKLRGFLNTKSSAVLIWIDWRRVREESSQEVQTNICNLAQTNPARSIVILMPLGNEATWAADMILRTTELEKNIVILNEFDIEDSIGWRDKSLVERNGTDLTNGSSIEIAKKLGLQVIPEIFLPVLKCLVLDLDNTLYDGVLGEDGLRNLVVTEHHRKLYKEIARLRDQGVFLAISSKNDERDTFEFLQNFQMSPFAISDFALIKSNWNPKSESIDEIARFLNIGLDSVAILDDNPAELNEIISVHSEVYGIYASSPLAAARILSRGPRTSKQINDSTKGLRQFDVKARAEREALTKNVLSPLELHQDLETNLEVAVNEQVDFVRLNDLFSRTNQFNVSLSRTNVGLAQIHKHEFSVATMSIADRYSDSGIIAAIFGSTKNGTFTILEYVVSCRALGRQLESVLLLGAVRQLCSDTFDIDTIEIEWTVGQRNQPAMAWLNEMDSSIPIGSKSGIAKIQIKDLIVHEKLLNEMLNRR